MSTIEIIKMPSFSKSNSSLQPWQLGTTAQFQLFCGIENFTTYYQRGCCSLSQMPVVHEQTLGNTLNIAGMFHSHVIVASSHQRQYPTSPKGPASVGSEVRQRSHFLLIGKSDPVIWEAKRPFFRQMLKVKEHHYRREESEQNQDPLVPTCSSFLLPFPQKSCPISSNGHSPPPIL